VCCAYGEKCCDYSYYAGTPIILGDTTYECTYNYYLVEKAKECGDGTCSSGENCLSCPSDCGCSSGECCASQSSYYHTDDSRGCADSGELIAGSIDGERSFCCEGNILAEGTDTCCFDSQCKEGQQCKHEFGGESKLAYCIAAPSPGTGASPGAGQQGAGATQPGASQPAAGAAQASASFLESFYSNYDLSPVMSVADKKYVPRSSFYAGLSTFYKGQAEYIDMPVAGLGKFTLIMDTLNDLTRSVVSVNPISFAIEIGEFMDELSQKIPEAGPLQNLVLNAYSVGSLAAGVSEETGWGQAAITKLTSKLPSNRVLTAITKRQAALQAKIMPDQASKSQFFLLDAADFVMDQTLMYYVRQEFDYAMVDFSEKIQLSIMAGELSRLYAKAEVHSLSEAEAVMLMETEYNFWNMVIARDTNVISNERAKSLVERAWSSVIERVLLANYGDSISSAEQVIGVAQQRLDMVKYGIDRVFGS
jgi:hypothetical protein